jgi:hypothetical protein
MKGQMIQECIGIYGFGGYIVFPIFHEVNDQYKINSEKSPWNITLGKI